MNGWENLSILLVVFWIGVLVLKILIDVLFVDTLQQIILDKNSGIHIRGLGFVLTFLTGVLGMIALAIMVCSIPYTEDSDEVRIPSED